MMVATRKAFGEAMLVRLIAAAFAVLILTSSPVWAFDAPKGIQVVKTEHGQVLTDRHGMTLYTFDRD